MLSHEVIGPNAAGRFLVTYPTPGFRVPTVACDCSTRSQAEDEADRLNRLQVATEQGIRDDHLARGIRGIYPDLED